MSALTPKAALVGVNSGHQVKDAEVHSEEEHKDRTVHKKQPVRKMVP
jgi:hypothetical protein